MYIDIIPNRNSRPTILLREAWREGKKVRKRTIANLSDWTDDKISALRLILKGQPLIHPNEAFVIEHSLSCGHVHAILKLIEKIRLKETMGKGSTLKKNIIIGLVVHTLFLEHTPHLAYSLWHGTTILDDLDLHKVTIEDVSAAIEWLAKRQGQIEGWIGQVDHTAAAAAYFGEKQSTAKALLHLLADHVNMNLQRVLSPLLSYNFTDNIDKEPHTSIVRSKCPLSLYSYENLQGKGIDKDPLQAMSHFDIIEELTTQCHIRLKIQSIPGGLTVNLHTQTSPLQVRVFELIEAYDVNGLIMETASWCHPKPELIQYIQTERTRSLETQEVP